MIQRRQTIFMFLSSVLSVLMFFMPLASFDNGSSIVKFTLTGSSVWPLAVLAVLMTALPVFTAFLYKKRERQVKLCQLVLLLNVVFVGLFLLYYIPDIQEVNSVETVQYKMGSFIPLLSILLEILAIRGIKKDIELLKSIDRLR